MKLRYVITAMVAAACTLVVTVAVSAQDGSSAANDDSLFAALAGKNERPRADEDGRGSFGATFEGDQLCYGYVVKNITDPIAAHIHTGTAGKNGGVVIPLAIPASGDPGTVSGCTDVDPALKADILRRPATYYVNVHTADFPGGAVRGQLFAKAP